jgi:hypothetical protein
MCPPACPNFQSRLNYKTCYMLGKNLDQSTLFPGDGRHRDLVVLCCYKIWICINILDIESLSLDQNENTPTHKLLHSLTTFAQSLSLSGMGTTKCTWIWWLLHRIPHTAILYGWCLGSQIRQRGEIYEECTAQPAWFGRHRVRAQLSSAPLRSAIRWLCWSARYLEKWNRGCGEAIGTILSNAMGKVWWWLQRTIHKEHGRTERNLEVQDIDNFVWHQVSKFPRQSSRHSTTVGGGIILQIWKSNK